MTLVTFINFAEEIYNSEENQWDTSKLRIRPIIETTSIYEVDVKRNSSGYDSAIGVVWPRPLRWFIYGNDFKIMTNNLDELLYESVSLEESII